MKKTTTQPTAQPKVTTTPAQRGKWVYKPINSVILVCACGNKYVATRLKQKTCVRCIQNV